VGARKLRIMPSHHTTTMTLCFLALAMISVQPFAVLFPPLLLLPLMIVIVICIPLILRALFRS
jgi:membrane-associated phospholipid phosphatase